MSQITLHIGAGKCGSSALQTALTRGPEFIGGGQAYSYTVISRAGQVTVGREITAKGASPYVKTVALRDLAALSDREMNQVRELLGLIEHPVMSNEALFNMPEASQPFLERLGQPVRVVAYVRPQVDYLNSAWWQWGAWASMPREDWITLRIYKAQWHDFLARWAVLPHVEEVVVHPLPKDVVSDFFGFLGHECAPEAVRLNLSLPGTVLRLLQRHPNLREGNSTSIDFELPKLLERTSLDRTPWVIDQPLAQRVITESRAGNEALLEMMSEADKAAVRADVRWWDPDAYADRVAEPFDAPEAPDPGMDQLTAQLHRAVLERGTLSSAR